MPDTPDVESVETQEDLPACTKKREGQVFYVGDLEESLVCKGKKWVEYDPSDDGSDEDEEECETQSSDSEAVTEVKSAGYYKTYCPAGHTCKDAAPSTYLKSGITYGEILDTRDDQVYKVVTIGSGAKAQIWMAQNLNYRYNKPTSSLDSSSFCYGDKADSCAKYGRLYLWSAAMDSAGVFSTSGEGCGYYGTCSASGTISGVCPSGWHLPTYADWETLFENVGGSVTAGTALKTATGWYSQTGDVADRDAYGFSALPAGYRNDEGKFSYAGYVAYFWSSSERNSDYAYYMDLYYDYKRADQYLSTKYDAFSVRCVQN